MSADFGGPDSDVLFFGFGDHIDPVANLNEITTHEGTMPPREYPKTPNLEGDPIAHAEIREAIRANGGRITFGEYMNIALYGRAGYYSQGKVNFQGGFGQDSGEFFTTPESTDDFSRAMCVGILAILGAMGRQPFNLLELGAGSGRMMKDVLATMRNEDATAYQYAHAYIADYGGMTDRQRQVIGSDFRAHTGSYAARSTPGQHQQDLEKVLWIPGSALELELDNDRPLITMCNEVSDAACTEVVRNNEGLHEQKYVAENEEGRLVEEWGELTAEVQEYINTYGTTIEPGNEVAISPGVVALQRRGCQLIGRAGVGGWINIDYGQDGPQQQESKSWTPTPMNTNMGVHGDWNHTGAVRTYPPNYNPLQRSGDIDLTHNPDFAVMREVAREEGTTEVFYGTQQEFVSLMGLPSWHDFERMRTVPGLTEASIGRIARSQQIPNGTFKTLIVTRGVEPDFSVKRQVFRDWREFFQASLI